jgi:hypothetical protein
MVTVVARAKSAAARQKRDELIRELRRQGWSLRRIGADRRVKLSAVTVLEILGADADVPEDPVDEHESLDGSALVPWGVVLGVDAALDVLDRCGKLDRPCLAEKLRRLLADGDDLTVRAARGWANELSCVVAGDRLDDLTAWRVGNATVPFVEDLEAHRAPRGLSEHGVHGTRQSLMRYAEWVDRPAPVDPDAVDWDDDD